MAGSTKFIIHSGFTLERNQTVTLSIEMYGYIVEATNSTAEPENFIASWLVDFLYGNKTFWRVLHSILIFTGLLLNCAIYDTARKTSIQSSGIRWLKLLALWDNLILFFTFANLWIRELVGDKTSLKEIVFCKFFSFFIWTTGINASAHLVCVAWDRVISISLPTWHFRKDWGKLIPRISGVITLFHCILGAPRVVTGKVIGTMCILDSSMLAGPLKVYTGLLVSIFSSEGHFIVILLASLVFIKKLKDLRKNKGVRATRENANPGQAENSEAGINSRGDNPNLTTGENRIRDGSNKDPKAGPKNKRSKLSEDDLNAIKTIQYMCLWYMGLVLAAASLYYLLDIAMATPLGIKIGTILMEISNILGILNHSFNFLFLIRGNAFRETFKSRWF